MADVFVIVNVKVLVAELNSQTTVAVENCPELAPTILIVSACVTVAARVRTTNDAKEKNSFRNVGIQTSRVSPLQLSHSEARGVKCYKATEQACRSITG